MKSLSVAVTLDSVLRDNLRTTTSTLQQPLTSSEPSLLPDHFRSFFDTFLVKYKLSETRILILQRSWEKPSQNSRSAQILGKKNPLGFEEEHGIILIILSKILLSFSARIVWAGSVWLILPISNISKILLGKPPKLLQ